MRRLVWLFLALSAAGVLVITLAPHNTRTQRNGDRAVAKAKQLTPDVNVDVPEQLSRRETDYIGNVLLFFPLGFFGGLLAKTTKQKQLVVPAGLWLSASVELAQGMFLPARHASFGDLLTNTGGTALGYGAALGVSVVVGAATRREGVRAGH